MAINEEARQAELARELEDQARTLAHSTRNVPTPPDSYALLGELRATVEALGQVCRQLGTWHHQVVDGVHYQGEDSRGDGVTGTLAAAVELEKAGRALAAGAAAIAAAHSANGVVRWVETPAKE